jgi:hypothetical protein
VSRAAGGVDDEAIDVDEQQRILQTVWRPHPGQRAIMDHDARFRVVACGRRWGKSEMAAHAALEGALETPDSTVWWVAPSYDQANDYGFDKMVPLLSPDIVAGEPKRTKPRAIEFVNGSTISFRSAEREDSLRGPGLDFLIIDEAGSVPERAWTEELRPALSDTLGEMLAIGTPRGRNWFYRWFLPEPARPRLGDRRRSRRHARAGVRAGIPREVRRRYWWGVRERPRARRRVRPAGPAG